MYTYQYTWVDVLISISNCQVCSMYSYAYLLVCLMACLSNFYILHMHTPTYILPYIYIHILMRPVWLFNHYICIRTYIYAG